MVKIVHITQSLQGGPASYFDEILPYQIDRYGAKNVTILVPYTDVDFLSDDARRATIKTFPDRKRNFISLMQFIIAICKVVYEIKPNIIHLHSTFAGAIARPIILLSGRRARVVYCAHGWAFERSEGKPSISNIAIVIIERMLAGITDIIVNLSQFEQNRALKLRIGAKKSVVIENAISDISFDASNLPLLKKELGVEGGFTNILFVGRFDRQKGIDIVKEISTKLYNHKYRLWVLGQPVVGVCDDWVPPDNTTLVGWLPRPEVVKYYWACDLLLMPSRWEGLPISLIEAMRAGLPALVSNRACLPDIVDDRGTGRVAKDLTADNFVQILTETSLEEWRRYGVNARRKFEERFNSRRLNDELDRLYCDLTGGQL